MRRSQYSHVSISNSNFRESRVFIMFEWGLMRFPRARVRYLFLSASPYPHTGYVHKIVKVFIFGRATSNPEHAGMQV